MKNWRQTVISQYNNSEILISLLQSVDAWIQPDTNYENFYNFLWNVDTAVGYGLDVWGRIVNIPRTVTLRGVLSFGFGEAGDRANFGNGPFGDNLGLTQNFELTDQVYRLLILAKAAYNITNGSVPAINAIMMNLFPGRGNCWVTDGANGPRPVAFGFAEPGDRQNFGQAPFGDRLPAGPGNMTLQYTFAFPLQPFEIAVVQSGVLPKPTGVLASWRYPGS